MIGIGISYGGCHNVWLREVKYYNSNDSLISEFIDDSIHPKFINKSSSYRLIKYANENDKWIIFNYKSKYNNESIKNPYFVYADSLKIK